MVELICPLCGADVTDGAEPRAGRCPGCGAHYAGGGDSAPDGVVAALRDWGLGDLPAPVVARRLFEVEPAPTPAPAAAITSDRRDGFYRWWVFARPGDTGLRPLFEGLGETS